LAISFQFLPKEWQLFTFGPSHPMQTLASSLAYAKIAYAYTFACINDQTACFHHQTAVYNGKFVLKPIFKG